MVEDIHTVLQLTVISSEKTGEICVPLVANTTFKILPSPAKQIYIPCKKFVVHLTHKCFQKTESTHKINPK